MTTIRDILAKSLVRTFVIIAVTMVSVAFLFASAVSAASTPSLALTNMSSSVNIVVTGADPYATVMFYYPTGATNDTSIDIGQTDSNGSFNVFVAPNSYGLGGGSQVHVTVDGISSSQIAWPAYLTGSVQTGTGLSLSQQNLTMTVGQGISVIALNTADTLSTVSNSNPSVVSASIQGNAVFLNALGVGSSTVTACLSSNGCGSVSVSVQSPSQSVSFSQVQTNVVVGQSSVSVAIYGPGSYYGLTNSNQNAVSAVIDGTNLNLTGLAVGQSVVSVCATGWLCGSITVNSLASGSAVPVAINSPAPSYSNQPPQLSSISISSNDVYGLFFGKGSTLTINFSADQGITNVQANIAGTQAVVNAGNNGLYSISYILTGNEVLPLPLAISFANTSGQTAQLYLWIGNSAALPIAASVQSSSGPYSFDRYLYSGMTAMNVADPDVTALQRRLKADGLYSGPITGYFGPLTKASVQSYQNKNGLDPLGVVGPSTRVLLNKGI